MAYETPTAADLIARYPAFAAVAPATIGIHLGDAARDAADTSWPEAEFIAGVVAFAAHNMALLGIGDHGEVAGYARQGLSEIKSGGFSAKFADRAVNTAAGGGLNATPYGRAYKVLLRKVKGGPRLVGGPVRDDRWGYIGRQNDGEVVPWADS